MKIGILTFHRAHNYGAVLQCYALQEVLKGMGHQVEIIDFRHPWIEYAYRPWTYRKLLEFKRSPIALYRYIRYEIPKRKNLSRLFDDFRYKYLNLSKPCEGSVPSNYDIYVIGSDQLWSKACLGGCLDPIYFGEFKRKDNSKVVGYAISSNLNSLTTVDKKVLGDWISNFNHLSVREETIASYLNKTFSIDVDVTIDPTLLIPAARWNAVVNRDWSQKNFILIYYVPRGFGYYAHEVMLSKAERLASMLECEIIDLSSSKYSVADFVSALRYARCVITSSYHATAFSVIFNRPIYVLKLHDGNDVRYVNLLNTLGMGNVLIEMDSEVASLPEIDYEEVNKSLERIRESSLSYLNRTIL